MRITGEDVRTALLEAEQDIEEMQANTGDENRRNRHQGHDMTGGAERRFQNGAFVFAEQFLDPSQCDRIDVPGVAGHVRDLFDPAIMRRMEYRPLRCRSTRSRSRIRSS